MFCHDKKTYTYYGENQWTHFYLNSRNIWIRIIGGSLGKAEAIGSNDGLEISEDEELAILLIFVAEFFVNDVFDVFALVVKYPLLRVAQP